MIGHLARGEALDVYDAWDLARHCRCVVKTPRPDRGAERSVRTRLRREGALLERLAHPHLVRAYATLEAPRLMVVLEPVAGETLDALLDRLPRPLPATQVALLGIQLAAALRYLHANGHLHLDVKPSNVVADGGTAKLLDLSLARPPGRARPGIGTLDYMAPEQARGDWLSAACDVWGLGAVLFEAATRRPAFAELSGAPYAQLERRAPRVGTCRRLPRALARLVDACLEPLPEQRPDVDAVLSELATCA